MSLNNFTLVHARPSASASPTDIWEVEEKKTKQIYIMKVFIVSILNSDTNSFEQTLNSILLDHELKVYEYLRDELIQKRNVRNILRLIDAVEFDFPEAYNFIRSSKVAKNLSDNQIIRNLINNSKFMLQPKGGRKSVLTPTTSNSTIPMYANKLDNLDLYKENFRAIVSPIIAGGSLSSYIMKNIKNITPWTLMRYVYIIFTTLGAMSKSGINQNDLHFGNVLIDDKFTGGPEFRKNYFLINAEGDGLFVDLESTLFIYDFDRAAVRGGKGAYKKQLEYVRGGGNCPEFHPKRDFLKILCLLYHLLVDQKNNFNPKYRKRYERIQNDIMSKIIIDPTIRDMVERINDHACWLQTDYNDSIYCDAKLLDKGLVDEDYITNWCFSYCSWYKNVVHFKNDRLCPSELKLINKFSSGLSNSKLKELIYYNTQFIYEIDTYRKNQIQQKLLNIILELRK
jgi:hypothetical protein